MSHIRNREPACRVIALSLLAVSAAVLAWLMPAPQVSAAELPCGAPGGWARKDYYEESKSAVDRSEWQAAEENLKAFILCNGPRLLADGNMARKLWNDLGCLMSSQKPNAGARCVRDAGQSQSARVSSVSGGSMEGMIIGDDNAPGCHNCDMALPITIEWSTDPDQGQFNPSIPDSEFAGFPTTTENIIQDLWQYDIYWNRPLYFIPVESAADTSLVDAAEEDSVEGELTSLALGPHADYRAICRGGNSELTYLFDKAAFEIKFLGLIGHYMTPEPFEVTIDAGELGPGECIVMGEYFDQVLSRGSFIAAHSLFLSPGDDLVMERSSTNEWQITIPAILEQFLDDGDLVIEARMTVDSEGWLEALSAEITDGIE